MHEPTAVAVRSQMDVFEARRAGRELAKIHGFGERGSQCVAIVVSELSTNIVKHGIEGTILLRIGLHESQAAMFVCARDRGPAIADFARALIDRSDAAGPLDPAASWGRGGIGSGLGAIARLSDSFRYARLEEGNEFEAVLLRDAAARRKPWRPANPG